ncbi:MAG: hypothetical protein Q8R29_02645 [bacterium]|nr:hypothetical protein [bacterium]
MNKNTIIAIVAVLVVAVAVLVSLGKSRVKSEKAMPEVKTEAPVVQQTGPLDTTSSINQDIDSLDLGDLEKEMEGIDSELNNL